MDVGLLRTVSHTELVSLSETAAGLALEARLELARSITRGRLVFTTSFGLEDQILADALAASRVNAEWVTLDTGRLFPATYDVWAATEHRYGRRVTAFAPAAEAVADLVRANGINGFYESPARRHECCAVRKVEPLGRALDGVAGWITGLRAEQSAQRDKITFASFDADRQLIKFNPLYDWPRDRVLNEVRLRAVPVNPLHAEGFASIGCAPCTRALRPGEPERAGRWWWEADAAKECGLHVGADGRLRRLAPEPAA